jgi:hypothetical protein
MGAMVGRPYRLDVSDEGLPGSELPFEPSDLLCRECMSVTEQVDGTVEMHRSKPVDDCIRRRRGWGTSSDSLHRLWGRGRHGRRVHGSLEDFEDLVKGFAIGHRDPVFDQMDVGACSTTWHVGFQGHPCPRPTKATP